MNTKNKNAKKTYFYQKPKKINSALIIGLLSLIVNLIVLGAIIIAY